MAQWRAFQTAITLNGPRSRKPINTTHVASIMQTHTMLRAGQQKYPRASEGVPLISDLSTDLGA